MSCVICKKSHQLLSLAIAFYVLSSCSTASIHTTDRINLSDAHTSTIRDEISALIELFERNANSKDPSRLGEGMHYPNYRLFNGELQTIHSYDAELARETLRYLLSTGWDRTEYGELNFIHVGQDKVHVDTPFARYREDGSEIGRWRSIYIFTRENDQWGLKFRSSYANLSD